MVRRASLFSQLIALFRRQFYGLVIDHSAEHYSKRFSFGDHFVAMLFCQLAQTENLREIYGGLAFTMGKLRHLGMKDALKNPILSYANAYRLWQIFPHLFYETLKICKISAPKNYKFRFTIKKFF